MTLTEQPTRRSAPDVPPSGPPRLSPPWDARRLQLAVVASAMTVVALWAIRRVGISVSAFIDGWDNVWKLLFGIGRPSGIWPPRWDDFGEIADLTVETLFMAILATVLAAVLSFPLGFLAARNTTPHPALRLPARGVIVVARSIPDLVFALIFVRAFGIGPTAGVLALGLHAGGMVGKLLADGIEETDPGPREAVAATRAGWFQQMATGVVPQIVPGPGELPTVWNVIVRMVPSNLDWLDEDMRSAMFDTIAIGFAAAAIGIVLALPLAYLGARNVAPTRPSTSSSAPTWWSCGPSPR